MNLRRFSSPTFFALSLLAVASVALSAVQVRPIGVDSYTFGQSAADKLGFWGATPVVQPAGAAQAALVNNTGGSTANSTLAAVTAPSALTDNTTGSASTTLASISDAATKNAVASLAARLEEARVAINVLKDNDAKQAVLINALRAALVTSGQIKGGAAE